jgi:hypothetical protein
VQSWQGEVGLSTPLTETPDAGPSNSSSSSDVTCSSAAHGPPAAAPAAGQPAVPDWLQQVISQQQQQQGQAPAAAATDSSNVVTAAAFDSGDAENAQALSKLGAVRRYNCMVADAPPALLQFLDDAADDCIASNAYALGDQSPGLDSGFGIGFGQGLGSHSPGRGSGFAGSPMGVPRTHRLPRPRQSFIVTDYFNFEGANSRIARTASGFVPAVPSCTPGRPGALFGRRTSSGIESVSSLQSQRSNMSLLQSQRSNVSGVSSSTLQSCGGTLRSRRGSGVESVVSMRTSSGVDTASMRSNSGIDAAQLSRFGSDVSEQGHDTAAATAAAAGVLPPSQQQQQQGQHVGPLRTSSGSSSISAASSSSTRSSGGYQLQRRLPATVSLTASGNLQGRLPTVASGSKLGTLAEGEAETGAGSFTNHKQKQQQQQQQRLQGGLQAAMEAALCHPLVN